MWKSDWGQQEVCLFIMYYVFLCKRLWINRGAIKKRKSKLDLLNLSHVLPLLLLQASDDPLQLSSFLPLHGLQDLGRTLGLTAGGALPSQRLTVLQDQGMLVVPVGVGEWTTVMSKEPRDILSLVGQLKLFPDLFYKGRQRQLQTLCWSTTHQIQYVPLTHLC